MSLKKKHVKQKQFFRSISLSLSSPDDILERSYGEVLKPETINYRSYKPERDGLFCERIFGPVKDFECYCGKYKRIRYKGIVCDRCGVEVTEKKVRRERMGHIKLGGSCCPYLVFQITAQQDRVHPGLIFQEPGIDYLLRKVCSHQAGVKADDGVDMMDLLTEEEYFDVLDTLPEGNQMLDDADPNKFIAKMGAEAVFDLLANIDLKKLSDNLRHQSATETSQQRKSEALKRLRVVEAIREGNMHTENRPEWMVIQYLPVIPPELRPLGAS
jgi:DNA-directed RNA polymerase subunit beta'